MTIRTSLLNSLYHFQCIFVLSALAIIVNLFEISISISGFVYENQKCDLANEPRSNGTNTSRNSEDGQTNGHLCHLLPKEGAEPLFTNSLINLIELIAIVAFIRDVLCKKDCFKVPVVLIVYTSLVYNTAQTVVETELCTRLGSTPARAINFGIRTIVDIILLTSISIQYRRIQLERKERELGFKPRSMTRTTKTLTTEETLLKTEDKTEKHASELPISNTEHKDE